jgi:LPPG:FO 2-phospho-L-lactate transferase
VLIAPSNPWLSVDPLLAVSGIRAALSECRAPVVAVSPLVGGNSVKGPTAKLMGELGLAVTNASIAAHYAGLLDGLLIHDGDDSPEGVAIARTDTLMHEPADRERVARAVLALAESLRS